METDAGRHYAVAQDYRMLDPAAVAEADRGDLLRLLYGEVCTSWRDLHEVRFRLLGLLPLATVGAIALAPAGTGAGLGGVVLFALGLAVSLGLWIYDRRNSELYDDLISRGRKIEAELGVETGLFRGRRKPGSRLIRHGVATGTIYLAVILSWAAGLAQAVRALLP